MMIRAIKTTILVAALALSACAAFVASPTAPPSLDGDPLHHLLRVDEHLYRSSQPTRADLIRLHEHLRVCRVVQLDQWWEARTDEAPGVEVVRIEVSATSGPTEQQEELIHAAIDGAVTCDDGEPGAVLIHCLHGDDRTGLEVGEYRWRVDHWSPAQAWAEMWENHFHPLTGLVRAWCRTVGWSSPS